MDGGIKSEFDTNRTNEVTKLITSLRMGEEFMEVCETRTNCEVFQEMQH